MAMRSRRASVRHFARSGIEQQRLSLAMSFGDHSRGDNQWFAQITSGERGAKFRFAMTRADG